MNNDKHKLYMLRILQDVFNDPELSQILAFKGGTSLMFFYQLPRFSVDLDFNILDITQKEMAYQKMREIALKYGRIADEQLKHNVPLVVLDNEKGERNLKLELSTRFFDNHYELKNLAGTNITVMVEPDMFAHKLCALLDRGNMAGRFETNSHPYWYSGTTNAKTICKLYRRLHYCTANCFNKRTNAECRGVYRRET